MYRLLKCTLVILTVYLTGGCHQSLVPDCDTCNTFTCLVDGQRFLPAGGWKTTNLSAFTYQDQRIDISANGDNNQFVGISLKLADTLRTGEYKLADYSPGSGASISNGSKYRTDATHQGRLTISKITFDQDPLIEGSFHFVCADTSTGRSLTLTEGWFRIRFGRYK